VCGPALCVDSQTSWREFDRDRPPQTLFGYGTWWNFVSVIDPRRPGRGRGSARCWRRKVGVE